MIIDCLIISKRGKAMHAIFLESFIKLKDYIFKAPSKLECQSIYHHEIPAYFNIHDQEETLKAKKQLYLLFKHIIAANENTFKMPLNDLKKNLEHNLFSFKNPSKEALQAILFKFKKDLESLYLYHYDALENTNKAVISDLIFTQCLEGTYSNALILLERILMSNNFDQAVLFAKKEALRQLAADFIRLNHLSKGVDWEIHDINNLYNYAAKLYNLLPVEDKNIGYGDFYQDKFLQYLKENLTVDFFINCFLSLNPLDRKISQEGLSYIENLLPNDDQAFKNYWYKALYQFDSQSNQYVANDIEKTKILFAKVLLQKEKIIDDAVNIINTKNDQFPKIYQTCDQLFIEEMINDENLEVEYAYVRAIQKSDYDFIYQFDDQLTKNNPTWFFFDDEMINDLLKKHKFQANQIQKLAIDLKLTKFYGYSNYMNENEFNVLTKAYLDNTFNQLPKSRMLNEKKILKIIEPLNTSQRKIFISNFINHLDSNNKKDQAFLDHLNFNFSDTKIDQPENLLYNQMAKLSIKGQRPNQFSV